MTNAIKFTPSGGQVSLSLAERASADADDDTLPLLLTVRDTGIGISPEDLNAIFLQYTKGSHTTGSDGVDRYEGAGLGLSIVKAIVEMHNGTISVDSAGPDQGSTVRVSLDLTLAPEQPDAKFVERNVCGSQTYVTGVTGVIFPLNCFVRSK